MIAEARLEEEPGNAEAARFADSCRSVLEQMYTAKIGPLDRVPIVMVPSGELRWLSIDHRAGFGAAAARSSIRAASASWRR